MSMAILKTPTLIHQRMSLESDARPALMAKAAADARQALEADIRAELSAQFEAKLEAARDEARAEGYKDGLASGHEDGQASAMDAFKKKQALLEQVLQKVEAQRDEWLQSVSEQALAIAKDALSQFMGEQAFDTGVLQSVIKRVTANLREVDVIVIRLHPTECQLLRSALKQSAAAGEHGAARMLEKLSEDSSLEAGGVVVDTPRGEYRATLDVQLRKLMGLIDERRAELAVSAPSNVYHAIRA